MIIDTNSSIENLLIYTLSFGTTLLFFSFMKKIFNLINNNKKNENNFLDINFYEHAPLDYFVFLIYLLLSYLIIESLKLETFISQLLVIWLTTLILSFLLFSYFRSKPKKKKFLLNRFQSSINYDTNLIVVISVFYIFLKLNLKVIN